MTDTPPPNIRVLKNGSWYDMDRHRLTAGGNITTAIPKGDSARGRELALIRVEKAKAASRKALAEVAEELGLDKSSVKAVGALAGESYKSAMANMMDKPREAVEAGKFALRLADMLPQADVQQGPIAAVQIIMAPEAQSFVDGLWTEEAADTQE